MKRMTAKSTAYHEAGHAVAAVYAGEFVDAIQVAPSPTVFTNRRGREVRAHGICESSASYFPRMELLMLLPDAEVRKEKTRMARVSATVSMMVSMAGPFAEARSTKQAAWQEWFESWGDKQRWEMASSDFPPDVSKAMEREAEAGATALVRKAWPAITKVAETLIECGSLFGGAHEVVLDAVGKVGFIPGVPRMPWAETSLGF